MDLGLGGRAYVVTGASSGVGLAVASQLLAEGAHVAACARDAERLEKALADAPMTRHVGEYKSPSLQVHDPQSRRAIREC